jgi:hypothetical protein
MGQNGKSWVTKLAVRAAGNSDELAEMRQENVLFGVAVAPAQDDTLFTKSIQEGKPRFASKL